MNKIKSSYDQVTTSKYYLISVDNTEIILLYTYPLFYSKVYCFQANIVSDEKTVLKLKNNNEVFPIFAFPQKIWQ